MIYFIADTHFGDERILRYENRPFHNAQDMDRELARRWNETVAPDDKVYVLGDRSEEHTSELQSLRGVTGVQTCAFPISPLS